MSEPPRRIDPGTSPGLAVTGLLGLGAVYLAANPRFGVMVRQWPWTAFRETPDRLVQVTCALWILTSVAALVLAFFDDRARRSTILMVLGAPVLTTAAAVGAAFPIDSYHLSEMLAFIFLGGALWHGTRRNAQGGRALAWVAGAVFLWTLVITSDAETGGARLVVQLDELVAFLTGESLRPQKPHYIVSEFLPRLLITLAAVLGLLHLLVRNVWVSRTGFSCLALGLLFPIGSAIGTSDRFGTDVYARALYEGLTRGGLVLWMLGTFVVADTLRERAP